MNKVDDSKNFTKLQADFYVSPMGNDAWSGNLPEPNQDKSDGPFATLERARNAVRAMKCEQGLPENGIVVEVLEGTYQLTKPLELSAEDSGTQDAPVVYRARRGEEVRLVGGRIISGFVPVTDPAILDRLDPAARENVLQTNLAEQGITDYGEITAPVWAHGQPGLELLFKGRRMTIARWPNEDFTTIVNTDLEGNTPLIHRGTRNGKIKASREGRFTYEGDRPKRWVGEKDAWLHGHWFHDWADQRQRIESIDTENRIITLKAPHHGSGYKNGQWYYAFNILSELDQPGEWYLDRDSGILYFWPPEPIQEGDAAVSITPVLVDMKDTSHVVLQGMIMEAVRGTAVTMEGGTGNLVCACTIRNTSSWGVRAEGGTDHGVVGCDIYELGEGGIMLEGGDRVTLTPGNHYAVNNHIHHCSRWNPLYQQGIAILGVGNRVAHNLLHNLPHAAIGFTGNDQVIEYNEIHSVVYLANDAGAIYTSPPDPEEFTMYGHTIRHNYVHHLYGFKNRGCNGAIYLDDFFPGTTMYGNVFYKVPRAAFVGGGRYNVIENNIFVDCEPSVHIDARGLGWAAGSEKRLIELLLELPYQGPLWSERYPSLVNILDDEPMVPKGNIVARNISWKGRWDEIEDKARPHVTLEDNLVGVDPLFVDEENQNFALREDSPAYKLGFKPIPMDKIGLYNDELRASWPVEHEVREGELDEAKDKTW
jgi:hypothetical protein